MAQDTPSSAFIWAEINVRLAAKYGQAKADEMQRHYREVDRLGLEIRMARKAIKSCDTPKAEGLI